MEQLWLQEISVFGYQHPLNIFWIVNQVDVNLPHAEVDQIAVALHRLTEEAERIVCNLPIVAEESSGWWGGGERASVYYLSRHTNLQKVSL